MKRQGIPPPLPNGRVRQVDLDAAVEEILQGLLKERELDEARARIANEKLERIVNQTHLSSRDIHDLREREDKAHAFTHRAAGELLKLGHASAALLHGTASDSSISLMLVTELAHAVRRIESRIDAVTKKDGGEPSVPSPFEKEMGKAFRELSLPAPLPPPLPPPLPADANDEEDDGYAELPLSPIADNVFKLFPASGTGGFDAMAATTKAMRRANGPMRAMALACAALLATVAFAGSDAGHGHADEPQAAQSSRCRYPAQADALPAQDVLGRQVVLCEGKPAVVLRNNQDGTIKFGPYES